ncbi:hypothetical protein FN846DRAFT_773590 [Sphaerosporella brunnea]|uniref:Uncharacterized protein n=1 Tax=Sphaerosporella brunnea TaxID=1250544 RepID=A0A5J5F682_9PEZI|nr:hypothetical protein FN846DRAFT_773590 [Sphaerosporella brunnea]
MAAAEVVNTSNPSSTAPETAAPVNSSIPDERSQRHSIFHTLRGFISGKRSNSYTGDRFEKICFQLARADEPEAGIELEQPLFELTELELRINTLEGKRFMLVLPPAFDRAGLGDDEEQGAGGTCDQFIGMLPASCRKVSEKASPLGFVPKLLPFGIISKEARYVGSCFWIWLCIVDDLTENLLGKEWEDTEADLFLAFSKNPDASCFRNQKSDAIRVSLALRNVIHSTPICSGIVDSAKETRWRESFMEAICEVLQGFREERPLLEAGRIKMYEWMRLRAITISTRPFFILARADLGLPPTVTALGNPLDAKYPEFLAAAAHTSDLRKVECLLQLILGLQNDILGWEKDFKTENPLSAIQVLIAHGAKPQAAMLRVINTHNELVRRCIQHAEIVCDNPPKSSHILDFDGLIASPKKPKSRVALLGSFGRTSSFNGQQIEAEKIRKYVKLIVGYGNGMAMWMAVSKRYAV